MSHVVVANYQGIYAGDFFEPVWKLTRAMLAAGWRYKASADATGTSTNKDTSSNPVNDKWAVGGAINYAQVGAQTGTAPVIGAASAGLSTISSVSGFTASSVGRFLIITGALNTNNNGAFRITAQTGTTVTVFNPGAVAETAPALATWQEVQGGAAASITASGTGGATPGRCIVSGLTSMVSPTTAPLVRGSVGDHLTIIGATTGANNGTYRITRVISSTSVEIDNGSATTDASNGAIIWVESSPLAQTYPVSLRSTSGSGAWIVLQGPSTMKIPIGTNTTTGTFLRGELVTQTTSGATGTILGVVVDTGGGTGFLTIMPRLNGTGSGVRGWTSGSTDTITGGLSGATVTSSTSVPVEYVRELVFWKDGSAFSGNTNGHIYVQCVDQSAESASRFSVIAAGAGITNVLAPGSGTSFPTPGSWVMLGTGNSAGVTTGSYRWWNSGNPLTAHGLDHFLVANCIETSTTDADGSWIGAVGTGYNTAASYGGMFYQRVDGSEDGDLDPYVALCNNSGTSYNGNRLVAGSTAITNNPDFFILYPGFSGSGFYSQFAGWRRRGFGTNDAWQQFSACILVMQGGSYALNCFVAFTQTLNAQSTMMTREPIWIVSTQSTKKMRKGYLRWIYATNCGESNRTYLNGTWVQLNTPTYTSGAWGPLVCGPWDGASIPFNG